MHQLLHYSPLLHSPCTLCVSGSLSVHCNYGSGVKTVSHPVCPLCFHCPETSARGHQFEKWVSYVFLLALVWHGWVCSAGGWVGILESQLEADSPPALPAGAPALVRRVKTPRLSSKHTEIKSILRGWNCCHFIPSPGSWSAEKYFTYTLCQCKVSV